MQVQVRLYAGLARYVAGYGSVLEVELGEGSTLADLVATLDLPADEVRLTFVNGRARPLEYQLAPRDRVGIFPPIGGG